MTVLYLRQPNYYYNAFTTKKLSLLIFIFNYYVITYDGVVNAEKPGLKNSQIQNDCEMCGIINEDFKKYLANTDKSNYGGGNTRWEEKKLGSFKTSETRLLQIIEHLCESAGSSDKKTKCHSFVESNEELIEKWWFHEFKNNNQINNLFQYLCIDLLKICCAPGKFGTNCTDCILIGEINKQEHCNGQGKCDGNGTRTGSGKCMCNSGYTGDFCEQCNTTTHFLSQKEQSVLCQECDSACKGCTGLSDENCIECANGYKLQANNGDNDSENKTRCEDVNECENDSSICKEKPKTYCENTAGSYSCEKCHRSCETCKGGSITDCLTCVKGYDWKENTKTCDDIDECKLDNKLCTDTPNQMCLNTPGTYRCICKAGFQKHSTMGCIARPKPGKAEGKQNGKKSKKDRKNAIIWTVPFALEFLKLFGLLIVFGVSSWLFHRWLSIVILLSAITFYFVYNFSISLDRVYTKYS